MSVIVKTDAVVLRAVKFSESSSIVTFYTERMGRIAGMIRGARRAGSRFASALQPMNHVSIVLYRKPGREVQTVSQCDPAGTFRNIPRDLDRISTGMQFVELVYILTHDEEENRELFDLLRDSLHALDAEPNPGVWMLYHFEIELLRILGFRMDFEHCAGCGSEFGGEFAAGGTVRFDVRAGGAVCGTCARSDGQYHRLAEEEFRLLGALRAGPVHPDREAWSRVSRENIDELFERYFRYHIPGYRKPRSVEVFRRMTAEDVPPRAGKQ